MKRALHRVTADAVLLLHVAFGSVRKLSILRDSPAAIPGHGTQKINAAYAFGGAPLMIETVEQYYKTRGMWRDDGRRVTYAAELHLDLTTVVPALAGPKRPQDRARLSEARDSFYKAF